MRPVQSTLKAHLVPLVVALCVTATPVAAQGSGQWIWSSEIGLRAETFTRSSEGVEATTYDTQGLDFRLDVVGAVVHPQFATFRLGLDAILTRNGGLGPSGLKRSSLLGFRSSFELFNATPYRIDLSFDTGRHDYSTEIDGDSALLGLPERSTVYLARLRRISRGPLRGLFFEARRIDIDFIGRQRGRQSSSKQLLDWNRTFGGLQNQLQVSHLATSYGSIGTETDDLTAFLNSSGPLSPSLQMNFSAFAIHRNSTTGTGSETTTDTASGRFMLDHRRPNTDSIVLNLGTNWGRISGRPSVRAHNLNLAYRFNNLGRWQVSPNLSYGAAFRDDIEIRSPRGGVTVTWRAQSRTLSTQISLGGSYGTTTNSSPDLEFDQTTFAYHGTLSLGHGTLQGLRKQLELEFSENEFRTDDEFIDDVPDPGFAILVPLEEKRARARLTLARQVGRVQLSAYGERQWTNAITFEDTGDEVRRLDVTRFNITAQLQRMSLTATGGETDFQGLLPQTSRFYAIVGVWLPTPTIRLRASYRDDFRLSDFGPDLDTTRLDAVLAVRLGLFRLEFRAFQTEYQTEGVSSTTNRGFLIRASRRFGGWLPIATSTRKGVIR